MADVIFEVGGEDQLVKHRRNREKPPEAAEWEQVVLPEIRIHLGTLLKTDNVSFLLGAGASVGAGGVLLGSIPIKVEQQLLTESIGPQGICSWVYLFYQAVLRQCPSLSVPTSDDQILDRLNEINQGKDVPSIPVNFEKFMSMLYRWRSTVAEGRGRLRLDGSPAIDTNFEQLETLLGQLKRALADHCSLPAPGRPETVRQPYKDFLRKILTRPLNLKRANLFTLNYDTLIEDAADQLGVVLLDGFNGVRRRIFRPESYDQDLYFPGDTTEGRVHRFDRVLHLYKLHGSVDWAAEEPTWENPYGVTARPLDEAGKYDTLIYPTPTKYGDTLGMPYSELFRRFAASVVRPQSTLIVIGYGFGDEHVNAIIRQALAIPSFTLVVVDPVAPAPDVHSIHFVAKLRALSDHRFWLFTGKALGTFDGFVSRVLPDLRDEEIEQKVMKTHRALRPLDTQPDEDGRDHGQRL